MQYEEYAPFTAAKGGCYLCTQPNGVVVLGVSIEGEGVLVLCTGCIKDISNMMRIGKARVVKARNALNRQNVQPVTEDGTDDVQ